MSEVKESRKRKFDALSSDVAEAEDEDARVSGTTFLDLLRRLGKCGRQELFKWNRPREKRYDPAVAARLGYVDFFRCTPAENYKLNQTVLNRAIVHKDKHTPSHLECIKWLVDEKNQRNRLSERIWVTFDEIHNAVFLDNLECVKFFYELDPRFFDSCNILDICFMNRGVNCIDFLLSVKCPISLTLVYYASMSGDHNLFLRAWNLCNNNRELLVPSCVYWASAMGCLETVKFLVEDHKVEIAANSLEVACHRAHLKCIQYLCKKNANGWQDAWEYVIESGDTTDEQKFKCIELLRSLNIKPLPEAAKAAIRRGNFPLLSYLVEEMKLPKQVGLLQTCHRFDQEEMAFYLMKHYKEEWELDEILQMKRLWRNARHRAKIGIILEAEYIFDD